MKISKKIIFIFGLLAAVISVPSALFLTGNIGNAKSAAYKRAKKIMNPDLYLTYRITERIVEALKKSVHIKRLPPFFLLAA